MNQKHCTNCKEKIAGDSIFCERCGKKLEKAPLEISPFVNHRVFYSRDWPKSGLYLASIPNYDILIDKNYLYLVEFPRLHHGTIGTILGFLVLSFLGALIGAHIGISSEKNKRKEFRSRWINSDNQLITEEYKNNSYFKIPIMDIENNLIINKKSIEINYDSKKIILKGKKEKVNYFIQHIKG